MNKETKTTKKSLERFDLSNKPTLVITKALRDKIDFLHEKVGQIEWSGELITREEGSINDLDDWKIIAEDMFLCDIGSSAFTGYEVGKGAYMPEDIAEMYDKFPGLLEGTHKLHHIHSHHNMAAFMSATDWSQMEDRASVSNYLLMLVVNFSDNWCAKVGFKAIKKGGGDTKLNFYNNMDGLKPLVISGEKDQEMLVNMTCNIVREAGSVDEEFIKRWEKVKTIKEKIAKKAEEERKAKYVPKYSGASPGWDGAARWEQGELGLGDAFSGMEEKDYEFKNGVWAPKYKKLGEFTDKEWKEKETGIGKFEIRHAKCFLNSILDGTYVSYDFSDCIEKIVTQDDTLVNDHEYDTYLEEFEDHMQEHFDIIFPYKNQDDYINLLKIVEEYLAPYVYRCNLIKLMLDSLADEIELYKEPEMLKTE